VTHCDWSDGGKNPREYGASPALFTASNSSGSSGSGAAGAALEARARGCLFIRKVKYVFCSMFFLLSLLDVSLSLIHLLLPACLPACIL
jgi:hypothetical protein